MGLLRSQLIIVFCLFGCSSPSGTDTTDTQTPTVNRDDSCKAIAAARAQDAAYNGYDRDMQRLIYDEANADCAASRAKPSH